MNKRLVPGIAVALVVGAVTGYAGVDVNNYNSLLTDEGPRAIAMGGAGYALARGCESALLNPAGLAATEFPEVSFDLGTFAGHQVTNICFAGWGFGFNLRYFLLTDELPAAYPPVAAFGTEGVRIGGGYGRALTPKLSVGAAVSGLSFHYGEHDATALALDVGAHYKLTSSLTVAMGVKHLGDDITWKPEPEKEGDPYPALRKVPSAAVAGMALTMAGGRLTAAGDLHVPLHLNEIAGKRGDLFYGRAGVEYWLWRWFALRGGYRSGFDELGTYVSLGAGFRFGDFDVGLAVAPPVDSQGYVSYQGEVREAQNLGINIGATYSIGRSRAGGIAETERRLGEEFERQKKLMVDQLMIQAEKFHNQGRYEDAVETLNIIMLWDPDNEAARGLLAEAEEKYTSEQVESHLARAREYLTKGSVADALVEAKKASVLAPNHEEAASLTAEAEGRLARETSATEAEPARLLKEAQEEYERGNYSAAIAKWSAVLARDPGNRVAATSIGAAQVRMATEESKYLTSAKAAENAGRLFEAKRYYEAVLSVNPTNTEARAGLERLDAETSSYAGGLADKAASALASHDYGRAESLARDALAYNPANAKAKSVLAAVAEAQTKTAKPVPVKKDYHGIYMKGIEVYTAHNYAAAISYWEQIPSGDPLYSKATQNIKRAKAVMKKLGG